MPSNLRFSMKSVAQELGVGRNKLFKSLRKAHVLNYLNLPYKQFIEAGYFVIEEQTRLMGYLERRIKVTKVTKLGKLFIKKLIYDNHLSLTN